MVTAARTLTARKSSQAPRDHPGFPRAVAMPGRKVLHDDGKSTVEARQLRRLRRGISDTLGRALTTFGELLAVTFAEAKRRPKVIKTCGRLTVRTVTKSTG